MTHRKPKLLVVGGGHADIPLIQSGQALGFHVISSGNRPHDLGHQFADEVRLEDFSNKDAMLALAKDLQIDAICAGCNDFAALSAAYVAEQLKLPGHDPLEIAELIHHKDLYREFARRNRVPAPQAQGYASLESALSGLENFRYPVIVKPVDLTGGKGIARADTIAAGRKAVERALELSRAKRVVVEEFIEGTRHGISTFVRNGEVVFYFHDDEYYYQNPYLVSAASSPGKLSKDAVAKLIVTIQGLAHQLNLVTGLVHVQFIIIQPGEPVIIEICRRAPGDLYIRFVQHATGVNYPEFIVRAAAGMDCDSLSQPEKQDLVTRHCIMAESPGQVRDVVIDPSVKGHIFDEMVWWKPGDVIDDVLTHKLGIVFLRFDSLDEMRNKTAVLQRLIHVDIV
jgi:biotin carboxylase